MSERRRRGDPIANDLREVVRDLTQRLKTESDRHGISPSQASVLARLLKHGPSTVADLARAEYVKPQSMGATIASLEEEGLVARTPDPNDARRWHASLTEAGKRVFLEGRTARQAWLSGVIDEKLDDDEQRRLADAVLLLRKLLVE